MSRIFICKNIIVCSIKLKRSRVCFFAIIYGLFEAAAGPWAPFASTALAFPWAGAGASATGGWGADCPEPPEGTDSLEGALLWWLFKSCLSSLTTCLFEISSWDPSMSASASASALGSCPQTGAFGWTGAACNGATDSSSCASSASVLEAEDCEFGAGAWLPGGHSSLDRHVSAQRIKQISHTLYIKRLSDCHKLSD